MKKRNKTWEVITAGCVFIALSAYLLHTPDASSPSFPDQKSIEVPQPSEAPAAPTIIIIDPTELKTLKEELGQLKEKLHLLETEQKLQQIALPEIPPLAPFKNLTQILISSP